MGATGVVVAMRLIDDLLTLRRADEVELLLVERGSSPGAGVAYGTAHDCHLVNMRAETMSLFDDRPGDFAEWLRRRPGAAPRPYVPRRLFAEYARGCLAQTVARATTAGMSVRQIRDDIVDCRESSGGVVLTAGGRQIAADHAVLALGDLPSTSYLVHRSHPRFIHSPWDSPRYEGIPRDATVAVLGAGLTAIDVLLLLRQRGHRGAIACFTRRSGLPKVQPLRSAVHVPRVVTWETLARLTRGYTRKLTLAEARRIFVAEIEGAIGGRLGWSYEPQRLRGEHSAERLARDIEDSRDGGVRWYDSLTSTWRMVPHVWREMRDADKAEFMERHYSHWGMYRHCMPLATAEAVQGLVERGQLTVHSGLGEVRAERADGGFLLARAALSGAGEEHRCDYVVNATGNGVAVERSTSRLVRSMLRRGDLAAHALGGVDVEFDSLRVHNAHGEVSRRVFFIGPLTRGVHFYTNGVEVSRQHAQRLVGSLLAEVYAGAAAYDARAGSC